MNIILSLKRFPIIFMAGMIISAITSCNNDISEVIWNKYNDTCQRTILVYMIAANSLNLYGNDDIAEMQEAAINNGFNGNRLLIYHQQYSGTPVLKEIKSGTGKIEILKNYDNSVPSLTIERMTEVFADTKNLAPADEYGLILWSHSLGWIMGNKNISDTQSISIGNNIAPLMFGEEKLSGNTFYMDIDELSTALADQNFNFIYFDCCYMACVEVLYELRNVTRFIGASAAEVISEGMPYQKALPYLFSPGQADIVGAINATYQYIDAITGINRTGTFAIFDMQHMDRLAQYTKDFYSFKPTADSTFQPQKFMYETTCYFFDFQHIIENLHLPDDADEDIIEQFEISRQKVLDAIDALTIYKANTPFLWPTYGTHEVELKYFCGISSYYITKYSQAQTRGYYFTSWWNDVSRYQFEAPDTSTQQDNLLANGYKIIL